MRAPPRPRRHVSRARLADSEAVAEPAGVDEPEDGSHDPPVAGPVGEPHRVALALRQPRRDDRLGPAEALDPVLAVAEADAGALPPAHRQVLEEVVGEDVVDVRRSDLE